MVELKDISINAVLGGSFFGAGVKYDPMGCTPRHIPLETTLELMGMGALLGGGITAYKYVSEKYAHNFGLNLISNIVYHYFPR